jgi:hypothetical protein
MSQEVKPLTTSTVAGIPATETTEQKTTPVVDPHAERMQQLARKEKSLRRQAMELKTREDALKATPAPPAPSLKDMLAKEDPRTIVATLEQAGYSKDQIAQVLMGQDDPTGHEIRMLKAQIEELKNENKTTFNKIEESQKNAYTQAVKQISREVSLLVDADEAYETIKATSSQEAVVSLIEMTYKEDGILLSAEDAAKQVEEYLLEDAMKLAQLKKVKAKLSPPVEAQSTEKTILKQTPPSKTLTHAVTTSTTNTMKDRRARAIAAFSGQLK